MKNAQREHKHQGTNYCNICGLPIRSDSPYRGYLIRQSSNGKLFIEKDGFHIGWANSLEHAKQIIDSLTNPPKTRRNTIQVHSKTKTNPPTGGYLGNTHAVVYKRFPGHHCDSKCKAAGHLYIHRFPKNQKTPLTFAKDKKSLKIG